jgi:hypothetical protein
MQAVSSYGSSTVSSGAVKIVMDTRTSIEGQHVVVRNFSFSFSPLFVSVCVSLAFEPHWLALLARQQ